MSFLKSRVMECLINVLEDRIKLIQIEINQSRIENALNAKSSVGDKHEVSNEMAAAEMERLSQQLNEKQRMLFDVQSVQNAGSAVIANGSLVRTSVGLYLIATAFGKIEVDNQIIFVISKQSPLANNFIGSSLGQVVTMNGMVHRIVEVV